MWRGSRIDRSTSLFLGLIVISLVLTTFDLRAEGGGLGGALRDGAQAVFTPIQKVMGATTRPFVNFAEGVSDLVGLRDENERLRQEVADLQARLEAGDAREVRLRELEAILAVEPPEEIDTVTAQVLAVGVSEFNQIRVIDKGRDAGITVDMPVIDEGGLVGRVVSVTDDAARIRLLTDPTIRVAVRVERTGETGVVTGRGGGPMTLEMFNTEASVVAGDLLVTADGRFPAGIHVARVSAPARAEVGFALRTTAEPTAELTRIDFVKVLVFTRDEATVEDLEELEEQPVELPIEAPLDDEGTTTSSTVAP
jgi:rod shape-determining protein MreC